MVRHVRIVTEDVVIGNSGKPVASLPVREWVQGETDAVGTPIEGLVAVEDALGQPVKFYTTKTVIRDGKPVPTIPLVGVSSQWWDDDALVDADFENNRYWFMGTNYDSLAAFTAAFGATFSGTAISGGMFDPGLPAIYTSDFSGGVDGWADYSTNPANGEPSAVAGALRLTVTGAYGAFRGFSVAGPRAALLTGTCLGRTGSASSLNLIGGSAANLAGNGSQLIGFGAVFPATRSVVIGSGNTNIYAGLTLGGAGTADYKDFTVKEVYPYNGYTVGELSYEVEATFPAPSGNKVLLQWGCGDEDHRIRVVFDTNGNMRQISTFGNTEGSNIDLGVLSAGSRHKVRGSCKTNQMYSNLDGGPVQIDTSATFPGLGLFWINRSVTNGEEFTGTTHRVKIFAAAKTDPNMLVDAQKTFRSYGDSTADGVGSTTDWYTLLAESYTPDRSWSKNANGGDTMAQCLAKTLAEPDFYYDHDSILTDRPNTGEPISGPGGWIDLVKQWVATRRGRWFVMPPVQNAPDTNIANIAEAQAALLADSFFAGHTLTAPEQAAYILAMSDPATRTDLGAGPDYTHDSDAGAVVRANTLKSCTVISAW